MKKVLIYFICLFSLAAHAGNERLTDSNNIPVYINIDDTKPTDFKCYKEINLSNLNLSGGNYNEILLENSAFAELASENNNKNKIWGMLCGYDPDCPVGTIYIGYAALGSSAATKYAAFICEEYSIPDRKNYEWIEYDYKETCHVTDNKKPTEIIKDKLYFHDNTYCSTWTNVATTETVENLLANLPNTADKAYVLALHNIQTSMTTLSTFYAGLDKNVWRNKDGDFNTARLISDATAGVVLGTAGGLISNKLIKKNQLKKGFDGISCYIGGQLVADYGDEFTVGMN